MVRPIKKLQIGKNGLTEAFISQVKQIFEKERVLKISILKSACRDKKEAEEISKKLVSELGSKFDYKIVGYVVTVMKLRKKSSVMFIKRFSQESLG